ncbi:SDR family NAD(P)-dependent oxidoreductase [Tuwongella immobilis]|uniref:Uncharacterized protein n=1 Tax=Tuwongella immobilis TaxID=692036 RepID=A0A6C2YR41_9BACT|nr:SDR family oxidoreductase [Tuwongella immobilis]VIP03827.1 short-chain dehydrogenase reductase sdr : Predicted protein OS=Chlamydomonas reinhardtii GN=CHLREDRAFT_171720 PE=4 SV=1: adh_short_C2 [Tuwongella immobilis]VTS05021.1 short-chain dehydrogenase reductase sdr : Predicted protein OS=Chlamydomonas reinhardtii GN=CHLREDRAFT_171720 PE=4 SV=1: adh_short_C2 [Tuwongella immobilis]
MVDTSTSPVTVIFGGGGGIGSEVARLLIQRGGRVLIASRDRGRLERTLEDLGTDTSRAQMTLADVTQSADVDAAFAAAQAHFGRVDAAVNAVGSILLKPAHLTTDDEWHSTLALNLSSSFFVLRAAAKAMLTTGGAMVFCSTVAAQIGLTNHEAIAAAKGGVDALVRSAAATYANRNIRVNAVAPGLVRTPLAARLTSSEASLKASTAMHPLGRIGEPADIAQAIVYLLSPEASWITGQTICVDGGMSTIKPR